MMSQLKVVLALAALLVYAAGASDPPKPTEKPAAEGKSLETTVTPDEGSKTPTNQSASTPNIVKAATNSAQLAGKLFGLELNLEKLTRRMERISEVQRMKRIMRALDDSLENTRRLPCRSLEKREGPRNIIRLPRRKPQHEIGREKWDKRRKQIQVPNRNPQHEIGRVKWDKRQISDGKYQMQGPNTKSGDGDASRAIIQLPKRRPPHEHGREPWKGD